MVARRKLEDFGSPARDGLPVRSIAPHSTQKTHYLWKYADTAALAMDSPTAFPGARAFVDLYASCGVYENRETHDLSWGSALLSLQVTKPFDVNFFNDVDPNATDALAVRVEAMNVPGASIYRLDLTQPDALSQARRIAEVASPFGPKIVISTGDANLAGRYVAELLRPFGRRRYILAFIDPFSAGYHWNAFFELTAWEKAMDVLALFPTAMDLGRNFSYYRNNEKAGRKLDRYFECDWRSVVDHNPQHAEHDLRVLYEQRMHSILGFEIGHPKGVGFNKRPLYHLIFGAKHKLGMNLWNSVNRRTPWEQDELFLDGA